MRYSLTSANDAPERDPKDFTLQGSSDGTTWTDLDTQSNIDFAARFATRTFEVATPGTYTYYCNLQKDERCRKMRGELVVRAR